MEMGRTYVKPQDLIDTARALVADDKGLLAIDESNPTCKGLDRLRDRLGECVLMGARFAKWRAVISIGDELPGQGCIETNANALAIGSHGHRATHQQAQDAHAIIRRCFSQILDEKSAQALDIQYGGGVKPDDTLALLRCPGVDGALIGGVRLHADEFLAVIRAAISEPLSKCKSA